MSTLVSSAAVGDVSVLDTYLTARHDGFPAAGYLAVCGAIGVYAITRLKDYAGKTRMAGGDLD